MASQMRSKLGPGGRLLIPVAVRRALELAPGDYIEFEVADDGERTLTIRRLDRDDQDQA